MLKMHNIKKIFRTDLLETHALRNFSLEVKEGEIPCKAANFTQGYLDLTFCLVLNYLLVVEEL